MPIEFQCPYCEATIRVPDKAGGGKGRCPKCTVRITVPKKSTLKSNLKPVEELPAFIAPVEEEEPIVLQEMNEPENEISSHEFEDEPELVFEEAPKEFDPYELAMPSKAAKPKIGELPVEDPVPLARKYKKKQKPISKPVLFGVAVGLIALVGGGIYFGSLATAEQLTGELMAGSAETIELEPVVLDKSLVKLPPEEVAELLKKLERSPVPLFSNSMQVRVAGTPKGLQISVSASPQMRYYRVNLRGNESIEKYLAQHAKDFDEARIREIDRTITAFFSTYQNVLAKKSPSESITEFRDSMALPALVRGFGHHVVASYGRALYRCVYEDRDGGLYFLLPEGVKEFEVVGRVHADGSVAVPAEFLVKVQGEIAKPKKSDEKAAPSKAAKATKTKSKKDSDDPDMDDDTVFGEK